jgi:hypothetical protein
MITDKQKDIFNKASNLIQHYKYYQGIENNIAHIEGIKYEYYEIQKLMKDEPEHIKDIVNDKINPILNKIKQMEIEVL